MCINLTVAYYVFLKKTFTFPQQINRYLYELLFFKTILFLITYLCLHMGMCMCLQVFSETRGLESVWNSSCTYLSHPVWGLGNELRSSAKVL